MSGEGDDISIRSDRSFKSRVSKLFKRRRPPSAPASTTDAQKVNADAAMLIALRRAAAENQDLQEDNLATSVSSVTNSMLPKQRPNTANAVMGGFDLTEDNMCKHNFQHDQPFGTINKRRQLPDVGTKSLRAREVYRIVVQSAQGLMAADRGGTSDPFAILRLGKQKYQTRTIQKTLTPEWNEDLTFLAGQGEGDELLIEVYDRDTFGTDFLGRAVCKLAEIPRGPPSPVTLKLESDGRKSSKSLPSDLGTITISVARTSEEEKGSAVTKSAPTHREGIRVILKGGRDLMIADRGGTSDPFAIVRLGKQKHQSATQPKTLNPDWNEEFFLPFEQGAERDELRLEVFDRDRFGTDYMGSAVISLNDLVLDQPKELNLELRDDGRKTSKPLPDALGRVMLTVIRVQERIQGKKLRRIKTTDSGFTESRVVEIKVVQAKDLLQMDSNGEADPYVKITIGQQTKKTKVVYKNRRNPVWNQAFRFEVHDKASIVKFEMYDKDLRKDEFMGVATLSLTELPRNEAQRFWLPLNNEGDAGDLQIVVSVSNPFANGDDDDDIAFDLAQQTTYCGRLTVNIKSARGLAAKDAGRTSDPFVVCELGNMRKRSKTIPKTCNPTWNESVNFNVLDIFDVLRVTVYDEDRGGKSDFLGALVIPLLEIRSNQTERFMLKTKALDKAFKGELVLSFEFDYKPVPAYTRLIKKREVRFFEEDVKLRIGVLKQNVQRVRTLVEGVLGVVRTIDRLFNWDYGFVRTVIALFFWIWATLYMYFYHVPIFFALFLLYKRYSASKMDFMWIASSSTDEEEQDEEEDDGAEKPPAKSQGRTAWYTALKNIGLEVQNRLGDAASMGEKIKNFFNWSVPAITGVIATIMVIASIVLYFIPLRYVLLVWGVRRFLKKGRLRYFPPKTIDKHREPVNEMKELLGRIPDDIEKVQRQRLYPDGKTTSAPANAQRASLDDEDVDV
eukprot:m.188128 g.188128  ORF g.188128 m.188128 type:complete len:957 (+) comp16719_c0_seq2:96-2966(+)